MSRIALGLMLAVAMLFSVTTLRADGAAAPKKEKKAGAIMGVVKAVDTDAKTFTLTVKEADKTFKYTDATKFMVGKEAKTAADVLVVGGKVGVMATEDTATVVKAMPAKKDKKKLPAKPE